MKLRYRLFLRRKSVYYAFDNTTKTFQSLKTKDEAEAERLLLAPNETGKQPASRRPNGARGGRGCWGDWNRRVLAKHKGQRREPSAGDT